MSFRKGARVTIWSVQPISDTLTKASISADGKNRDGNFEKDFSGFVTFVGTANAKKAAVLKPRDHIIIGDCEVKMTYDEEKKPKYTNFNIFSFEMAENKGKSDTKASGTHSAAKAENAIDHNPVEESKLPF